ncbi:MAG: hypothetical protein EBV65_07175 [Gammaproteobacteria bacterium]|jgi:hypothetical protein|nr:hypothetical protein [Gammaproteobacteria bacterium]NBR18064.1 hypothetical protein [Gammaproteobacteria bacterium]NCW21714.1 hypothetical protein [Gammaproteobacteria bacterium]NCW57441.1 hypothetical protein [Gammaproteobacteria bacterium]NDA43436.1 hypothetical protein [Gammaproteobacteria bacterium]
MTESTRPQDVGSPDIKVKRSVKGRRPQFFDNVEIDRLHGMMMAMATEMAVLYQRIDTMERVAAEKGVILREDLERHVADAATESERELWRQKFLDRLFYLYREELDDRMARENEAQYRAFLDEIAK